MLHHMINLDVYRTGDGAKQNWGDAIYGVHSSQSDRQIE